jgi:hypothetical protein
MKNTFQMVSLRPETFDLRPLTLGLKDMNGKKLILFFRFKGV